MNSRNSTETIWNGIFRESRNETFGFLKNEMVCDSCGFETTCISAKIMHRTGSVICKRCFFMED